MPTQSMVDPKLLRPNPWNSNHVSPENETKLAESIKQLGMYKPIVVRQIEGFVTPYEILGGENRWHIAISHKLKEVPIFDVGIIDDITAKKIALSDNSRFGTDDTAELAAILEAIGDTASIAEILPYQEQDFKAIFSSADIALDALDELDLDEGFEKPDAAEKPASAAPKTHTMMRFKVPNADAERITEKIAKTQKRQGFTTSDDLTNAGDALVHMILTADPEA